MSVFFLRMTNKNYTFRELVVYSFVFGFSEGVTQTFIGYRTGKYGNYNVKLPNGHPLYHYHRNCLLFNYYSYRIVDPPTDDYAARDETFRGISIRPVKFLKQ